MAKAMFEVVLPDYSKNFNQFSNLVLLKMFLIYLLLKIMLLEATSNLNISLFQSRMKKTH